MEKQQETEIKNLPERELRVKGVPRHLKKEIKSLADYEGTDMSKFVKKILIEKVSTYPEYMRKFIKQA